MTLVSTMFPFADHRKFLLQTSIHLHSRERFWIVIMLRQFAHLQEVLWWLANTQFTLECVSELFWKHGQTSIWTIVNGKKTFVYVEVVFFSKLFSKKKFVIFLKCRACCTLRSWTKRITVKWEDPSSIFTCPWVNWLKIWIFFVNTISFVVSWLNEISVFI